MEALRNADAATERILRCHLIGITDIWDMEADLELRSLDLANRMRNRGIRVALSSLLPPVVRPHLVS